MHKAITTSHKTSKMKQEKLMTDLPSEIVINILSRLPARSIISCKCVCKSMLDLLSSREFVKSHLSKSKPGLVFYPEFVLKIFDFDDSPDLENHELHYIQIFTKFNPMATITHAPMVAIQGSANGLLFLREFNNRPIDALYICNPITRDYIQLPIPKQSYYSYPTVVSYGFGVGKLTGQHKVVRVYHDCIRDEAHRLVSIPKSICQVYTLGSGSWRIIAPGAPLEYNCRSIGAFFNGNLHWLVADLKGCDWISCFDLETEIFNKFSPPPNLPERRRFLGGVVALGDCLCLCDNTSADEIVIWLMKEYGVEKSWTKEFVISKIPDFADECYEVVYPLKVFKDGDILMAWDDYHLFYYSNKTKTLSKVHTFEYNAGSIQGMLYTPSFLSLRSFAIENAKPF